MFEVRLHGSLWKTASPRRAEEWRRALDELNGHNGIAFADGAPCDDAAIEVVCPPDGSYLIRTWSDGIRPGATITLASAQLAEHFDDYGTTIRQMVHVDREAPRLAGCGLVIVTPPWTLAERLAALMPPLTARLAQAPGAAYRLETLVGE